MTEREHGRGEGREPLDEEAAWAQIVAGYGDPPDVPQTDREQPADRQPTADGADRAAVTPEGAAQPGAAETGAARPDSGEPGAGEAEFGEPGDAPAGALLEKRPGSPDDGTRPDGSHADGTDADAPDPGAAGREDRPEGEGADGPVRSLTVYAAGTAGPRDWRPAEPGEEDDHFVPPEPPPLPKLDTTARFAWLAVLGGPALLFGTVIFQLPMTWWVVTLGIGGFLGGFGTLVARMKGDDEEDGFQDPGRGAVV